VLRQALLRAINQRVSVVLGLNRLLPALIRFNILLSLACHALNIFVRESPTGLNYNVLLLARGLILGTHIHNAVGVNVESYFDLRHTANLQLCGVQCRCLLPNLLGVRVFILQGRLEICNSVLNGLLIVVAELLPVLRQALLRAINQRVSVVLGLNRLLPALIRRGSQCPGKAESRRGAKCP